MQCIELSKNGGLKMTETKEKQIILEGLQYIGLDLQKMQIIKVTKFQNKMNLEYIDI